MHLLDYKQQWNSFKIMARLWRDIYNMFKKTEKRDRKKTQRIKIMAKFLRGIYNMFKKNRETRLTENTRPVFVSSNTNYYFFSNDDYPIFARLALPGVSFSNCFQNHCEIIDSIYIIK